jgi:ubiquinone/menaquinone biosynthesis C-methylase UbiE
VHRNVSSVDYLGTDVVPELLAYARAQCVDETTRRFALVDGLTIPDQGTSADFVVFFSVFTHLYRNECLTLLEEAKRVVKPGGRNVVPYLDPAEMQLWYLLRFLCSQAAWRLVGRGAKGVLSRKRHMTNLAAPSRAERGVQPVVNRPEPLRPHAAGIGSTARCVKS